MCGRARDFLQLYDSVEAVKIINQRQKNLCVSREREKKATEKLWWKWAAVMEAPMYNKKHSNATNDIWRKTIYNNFLFLFSPFFYHNRREKLSIPCIVHSFFCVLFFLHSVWKWFCMQNPIVSYGMPATEWVCSLAIFRIFDEKKTNVQQLQQQKSKFQMEKFKWLRLQRATGKKCKR